MPSAKPSSTFSFCTKTNIYSLAVITFFCSFSTSSAPGNTAAAPPPQRQNSASGADFSTHHAAEDGAATVPEEKVKSYPACGVEYKKGDLLKCRIPAPYGYRNPPAWPASRDVAWYSNVPHKELTVEKAVQNWIIMKEIDSDFLAAAPCFPMVLMPTLMISESCELGSLSSFSEHHHNVVCTRDTHEAQVQFALERGVPALIGVLASIRLPYPSRAFDMAHCSRCSSHGANGVYLIEVDRRSPGRVATGCFLGRQSTGRNIGEVEKDDIAIWQKPINHLYCKVNRKITQNPPFCLPQDPDRAWYTKMETCLTPLPEVSYSQELAGGELAKWPERLNVIPPRISSGSINGVTAEIFQLNSELWKKRMSYYKAVNNQLRQPRKVPKPSRHECLPGCEAMSTYPRTYDLIHADSVFSLYKDRCEMEDILLEMDRILRPEGSVILRDDVDVLVKIKRITDGLNWMSRIVDHEDGPHQREKLLFAVKSYWTAPAAADQEGSWKLLLAFF
ncbi:putative methyltransferase PMT15 [Vitis vinifera]|uniref:Methyltransferase n=1 Tax=Vitis vinifera TaxID=29760 RepID=A0A438GWN3_VITVI|nr:putative methyltransferase PMT15 [Vitis vinifera]